MSTELKTHQLSMTVLMSPEMANFSGKVHGGAILRLLDQVAYACASRYAGSYVVTLSVDQVMFRQPIAVGELVTFLASVNYTGTSSMEIGIKVVAEDILKRSVRHANSCFFTMVAVDEEGRPTPVPPLQPATSDEKRRQAAAQIRRQLRQEMEQRHLELLASNPPSPALPTSGHPVFCTPCETPFTHATSARSRSSSSRPLARQRCSRSTCSTLIGST